MKQMAGVWTIPCVTHERLLLPACSYLLLQGIRAALVPLEQGVLQFIAAMHRRTSTGDECAATAAMHRRASTRCDVNRAIACRPFAALYAISLSSAVPPLLA